MTNYTCVKSSISSQAYKIVSTNYHEISGWKIISRLIHWCAPHLGEMNNYVQSDLFILELKKRRTTWMILYQNSQTSTGNYTLCRNYISYKTYILVHEGMVKEIQNQRIYFNQDERSHHIPWQQQKTDLYTGVNIHGLYHYLEIIGSPMTLNTSGQCSCNFGPSYSIKNDTSTIQPVIADLCMRQKIICGFYGIIGHKADTCIIRGPKLLSPSLRRNMNQLNSLNDYEPTDPPREWNIQLKEAHFKYRTSPTKSSTLISDIMGMLSHHSIDNGDFESHL